MDKGKAVEILMLDGCTRHDAEEHLQNGSIIFDDFEEHIETYCKELSCNDAELENDLRTMVKTKEPTSDWGIVEMDGKKYYIMYCL